MVRKITNIMFEILSLYRSNYQARYHVREIAKMLKVNHSTILPHLAELEKDKILVSEEIGKNKSYSLSLENFSAKRYMIMTEEFQSLILANRNFLIKKIIAEMFKLNLSCSLVLFGSYAKGTEKKESDIDIFGIGKLTEPEQQQIRKIGRTYGKEINLKIASQEYFSKGLREHESLIMEVVKNHYLLQNVEAFVNTLWRYHNEIRQRD